MKLVSSARPLDTSFKAHGLATPRLRANPILAFKSSLFGHHTETDGTKVRSREMTGHREYYVLF